MKWLLNFNIVKTFVMHLGNSNPCLTYYMDGQPLQVVSEHKYLGIIVDSSLKFHSQATSAIIAYKQSQSCIGINQKII